MDGAGWMGEERGAGGRRVDGEGRGWVETRERKLTERGECTYIHTYILILVP